ncbi:cytidylyltransferase [bacterium]|nr:MAG: cytidylyltransferase [bacterium]
MIAALIIGKKNSMGCPGKNIRPILGRPMVEYAFMAASQSQHVDRVFTSTDSEDIAAVGKRWGAEWIERPRELATPDALTEDALLHAFREMERRAEEPLELIVLLFANAPTIPPGRIDEGIEILRKDKTLDSAFTVCKFNMWSPLRARRLSKDNLIEPFVDLSLLGDESELSSIRGTDGDCYFVDLAVQILRRNCFTNMQEGALPFKWMGQRSYALENDYGFDIDYEWQIPVVEHWLKEHGYTEAERTPRTKQKLHAV